MDYRTVRTDRYKLVHWMQHPDERELYDLQEDPYDLIDDPAMNDLVANLEARLGELILQAMGIGSR